MAELREQEALRRELPVDAMAPGSRREGEELCPCTAPALRGRGSATLSGQPHRDPGEPRAGWVPRQSRSTQTPPPRTQAAETGTQREAGPLEAARGQGPRHPPQAGTHLLGLLGQVQPVPPAQLDQSLQVPHGLWPQRILLHFLLEQDNHSPVYNGAQARCQGPVRGREAGALTQTSPQNTRQRSRWGQPL